MPLPEQTGAAGLARRARAVLAAMICVAAPMARPAAAQAPDPAASLLIRDVTVVSAHLGRAQPNMDVLIAGDRILEVSASRPGRAADRVIDGRGRFLIPGLIDSHVHLGHNPMIDPAGGEALAGLRADYRRQQPRSFLFHGVTSVVDLDYSAKRNGWPKDAAQTPHVYHCGRGVRVAGGYGPAFVPPAIAYRVFPNLVYDAAGKAHWPAELDPADYTVAAAVRRVVQAGAVCLKTYVEPGFGGVFDWPTPSPETLSELTAAAHRAGLAVVIHANSAQAWRGAVAAGADVIAHGMWHWDGARHDAALTVEARAAAAAAAEAGVAVQPTLRVVEGEKATLTWNLASVAGIDRVLPTNVWRHLQSDGGRWSQRSLADLYRRFNPTPEISPRRLIRASIRRATSSMQLFVRSGGELLLGSDTPAQDGVGNPPGLNTYLEIRSWARAGVPLDRILMAATLSNARAFGLDDEIGSIQPGKRADLALLGANPLDTADAYNDIRIVVLNGVPIDRTALAPE